MTTIRETIFDVGNVVICDSCGKDYTDSDAVGGLLFVSNGVCPECVPNFEAGAKKFNEEQHIRARANDGETFRAFILRMRAGNNKVIITSVEK